MDLKEDRRHFCGGHATLLHSYARLAGLTLDMDECLGMKERR